MVPVQHREALVEREVGDCYALLNVGTGEVVVLNETASDIWRLSDGDLPLESIVSLLARAYAAEPNQIRADVERSVASLVEHGFLTLADR